MSDSTTLVCMLHPTLPGPPPPAPSSSRFSFSQRALSQRAASSSASAAGAGSHAPLLQESLLRMLLLVEPLQLPLFNIIIDRLMAIHVEEQQEG